MEQYYLRMRGQVSGPYTLGQLQDLRLRGHLGRFHEVSLNQVQWAPASSIPALFSGAAPMMTGAAAPVTMPAVVETPMPVAPAPVLSNVAEWYYLDRNGQ